MTSPLVSDDLLRSDERPIPQLEQVPPTLGVPAVISRNFSKLKEAMDKLYGDKAPLIERSVRWRDLWTHGLIGIEGIGFNPNSPGTVTLPPTTPTDPPDLSVPPAPTGLTATGGFATILLQWNPALFTYYGYTEILRNSSNNLSTAVLIGSSVGAMFVDSVGASGTTYYYWVRFVNKWDNSIKGAESSVASAASSTDPTFILDLLSGQITESELYATLASRIDLIDAPSSTTNSVNKRIQDGDNALASQIATLTANSNATFDPWKQWSFDASAEGWTFSNATSAWANGWLKYTSPTDPVTITGPALASEDYVDGSAYPQVKLRVKRTAGSTWDCTLKWKVGASWYSQAISDPSIGIDEIKIVLVDLYEDANWAGQTITQLELEVNADSSAQYEIDWVAIGRDAPGASYAALQKEIIARADGDDAIAADITNLQASLNDKASSVALAAEASVRASETGYLGAQYTLRMSLTQDGRTVSGGFGISGTSVPGQGATIDAGFLANKFYIGAPVGSTGASDIFPFVVQTTPTTINGVTVPIGVYMSGAYIQNGTITNAKIGNAAIDDAKVGNLAAVKLTAGDGTIGNVLKSENFLGGISGWIIRRDGTAEFAAGVIRGQLVASQIDTRGLTIKDTNGNILFGSGTAMDWSLITNQPPSIYNTNISIVGGAIAGIGTGNGTTIANSSITISGGVLSGIGSGSGTLVDNNLVTWLQVNNKPYFGAFSALDLLTAGNITTYIQGLAVGTSLIANAAITRAKILDGEITNAKIENLAVSNAKIANLAVDNAKIADLAVTEGKIQNLSVSTLKLANQAVIIPQSSESLTTFDGSGTWQQILSCSITLPEYSKLFINCSVVMATYGFDPDPLLGWPISWGFRILRTDLTPIYYCGPIFYNASFGSGSPPIQPVVTFGRNWAENAGTHTFYISFWGQSINIRALYPFMSVMATRNS